ncbi:hypothetical protein BZA05DRAFT_89144 [Tricharina praecox]|uniref:uncharacterized protein n=1 Tax=Tricharina praecox TaxID=43433 RepID=UPI002220EAA6|nr:uncharacterized protein BZA05DRAFT_89144 [Tricharina praecox]KAI5848863.1 hypothetical protein BZA05DRAFT_89144 [Tricharina praecox]
MAHTYRPAMRSQTSSHQMWTTCFFFSCLPRTATQQQHVGSRGLGQVVVDVGLHFCCRKRKKETQWLTGCGSGLFLFFLPASLAVTSVVLSFPFCLLLLYLLSSFFRSFLLPLSR